MATKKTTNDGLTNKEVAELLALDKQLDTKPDVAVRTLLAEADELTKVSAKDVAKLSAGTELSKGFNKELIRRASLAKRGESAWDDERTRRATTGLRDARKRATALKRSAVRALRYFLRKDDEVQARVDEIMEGGGDIDLADDCQKLAALVREHADALKKAKLGSKPADALAGAGAALTALITDAAADETAGNAQALRNRSFWYLRELMDDVRDAGRYVFSDDPRRLTKYRATSTLVKQRRRGKGTKPAKPKPAAPTGPTDPTT